MVVDDVNSARFEYASLNFSVKKGATVVTAHRLSRAGWHAIGEWTVRVAAMEFKEMPYYPNIIVNHLRNLRRQIVLEHLAKEGWRGCGESHLLARESNDRESTLFCRIDEENWITGKPTWTRKGDLMQISVAHQYTPFGLVEFARTAPYTGPSVTTQHTRQLLEPQLEQEGWIRIPSGEFYKPVASDTAAEPGIIPSATAESAGLKCAGCGAAHVQGAKFCAACGHPLQVARTCRTCNAQLIPGGRFCAECGASVEN